MSDFCKDKLNTAYRWGIVVDQPNMEAPAWRSSKPNLSNVGQWCHGTTMDNYRTINGVHIMVFNSEAKATEVAEKWKGAWTFKAKLIPRR